MAAMAEEQPLAANTQTVFNEAIVIVGEVCSLARFHSGRLGYFLSIHIIGYLIIFNKVGIYSGNQK